MILNDEGISACCFCGTKLENNPNQKPGGGFYIRDVKREIREAATCKHCYRTMILPKSMGERPSRCLYCGDSELSIESHEVDAPEESIMIPFSITREEAVKAFQESIRKDKRVFGGLTSKANLEAITPAYVPCFFFDYHVYANAILSVVPYVKELRDNKLGDKLVGWLLINDMSFERTSNVAQPYSKSVGGEMAWKDVPLCASSAITRERFFQVAPFSIKGTGKDATPDEKKVAEQAVILGIERSSMEITEWLKKLIRGFVKECLITTNLDNFKISSYVDKTEYGQSIGQLIYVPMWCLKIRKKDQYTSWYMNGISGNVTKAVTESVVEQTLKPEENSLKSLNKKRIKNFTLEDFEDPNRSFNYRTYMVDAMASAISADMALSEMAADKSLLHLEQTTRRNTKQITVPIVNAGYQAEAEEEVKKSKLNALPSAPVELPSRHSQLYVMKEEAMKRSLNRGPRLPSKPLDRHVGNEQEYENLDNSREYIAKEVGLADLPEYDPNGPNPFKKGN